MNEDEELSWAIRMAEKWSGIKTWVAGENIALCYKCWEYGRLGKGGTESAHYPKDDFYLKVDGRKGKTYLGKYTADFPEYKNYIKEDAKESIIYLPRSAYLGKPHKIFEITRGKNKGKTRVVYNRYKTRIIRHYVTERFHKDMERYRAHEIKSRSNGQERHYVEKNVEFVYDSFVGCMVANCDYPRRNNRLERID